MKRIATRVVSLLGLGFVLAGGTFACASEEGVFDAKQEPCDPQFCPTNGTGTGCCIPSVGCGVDYGLGCVPARDGG